jgi:hypothetical protein
MQNKPTIATNLNEAQIILLKTYADGDNEWIVQSEQNFIAAITPYKNAKDPVEEYLVNDYDDTLLLFLYRELANDHEKHIGKTEAIRRVRMAMRDLETLQQYLENNMPCETIQ